MTLIEGFLVGIAVMAIGLISGLFLGLWYVRLRLHRAIAAAERVKEAAIEVRADPGICRAFAQKATSLRWFDNVMNGEVDIEQWERLNMQSLKG